MDLEEDLKNVIQFQNKRTGSTFLQIALNTHPDLVGLDEIFVNVARRDITKSGFRPYMAIEPPIRPTPEKYIKNIWSRYTHTNVAFKLMYNQIEYHKGLLDFIKESQIPIIHLKRRNLLKQAISYFRQTNAMPINYLVLYDYVVMYEQEAKKWTEEFEDHDVLELFYEDMIGDQKDEFTYLSEYANVCVCNFFDVPDIPMFSGTIKKRVKPIWEYIPDKQGAIKKFKDTKYDWMLYENKSKEG